MTLNEWPFIIGFAAQLFKILKSRGLVVFGLVLLVVYWELS